MESSVLTSVASPAVAADYVPSATVELGIVTKPVGVAEILASKELLAEYARECYIPLIGDINPQPDTYDALERAGVLKCFGAFDGERMVGFATVLAVVLPHYGRLIATVESLFAESAHRNSSVGQQLFDAVETCARDAGCVVVFYSAPSGSRLEKILAGKKDFMRTNAIFCRSLR